jgi:putative DNA primase/helicase
MVDEYFPTHNMNIGVLTGEPSNGLVDGDLDWPEALPFAKLLLRETRTFGRNSNILSHWEYYTSPIPGIEPFVFNKEKVVELRGTGGQTIIPPSVHVEGELIRWDNDREIARVPYDELRKSIARVATGAVLTRMWPRTKGSRDDLAMALAGALLRAGWSVEEAASFIDTICRTAGDEEYRDRAKKAKFTNEKLNGNQAVTGWPTVSQMLGKEVVKTVCAWLGIEPRDAHRDNAHLGLTDLGNARRLVDQHGADLRYVHIWDRWIYWNTTHWENDNTDEVVRRSKSVVKSIYVEAGESSSKEDRQALSQHAVKSESEGRIKSMASLAQSEIEIAITPARLDTEAMLLNCNNGTIDLTNGHLRAHDRNDFITRIIPIEYDPEALCPRWDRFLEEIFPGKPELSDFFQRAFGYSLTGDTSEQVFFICWGAGANGKSTTMELLRSLVADYGRQIPAESLMVRRVEGSAPSNDLAALKGARIVTAAESEEGQRLAESRVKSITGGETILARHLYSEFFEFKPEFKLWLSTNHKPVIRGTDIAIWRRIRLIPFTVSFAPEKQDRRLIDTLRGELPGVLAWAVRGCLQWKKSGLGVPEEVTIATDDYRCEMDTIAEFLQECCIQKRNAESSAKALYQAFVKWVDQTGERKMSQRAFGLKLSERNFDRYHGRDGWRWLGVGLLDTARDPS